MDELPDYLEWGLWFIDWGPEPFYLAKRDEDEGVRE